MVECLESANSATCREADLTECGLARRHRIALDVEASDTIDNVIDVGHFELINFAAQPYYVAIITPVIHYCMGGLEIDENSAVLGCDSEAIRGLYAAGEVAEGVHGNNRLGGNSLLDCVVFGRVAGAACAKYMLGDKVKATSLAELSGGGLSGNVEVSKLAGGSYEDTVNAASIAPAKKQKKASSGYTMEEVVKHTKKGDVWVVLHGRVLNVSNFLSQHPGGELAISTFAGKDATAEFDMIHPPDVVEKYAPDAVIGTLGDGGEDDDDEEDDSSEGGYTMEGVAKHNKKGDVCVVLNGRVLSVSKFLSQHPGGELAILTFAGKDATAEFDMIHPPDVVEKYAPDAIIGVVGNGKANKAKGAAKSALPVATDKGDPVAHLEAWGDWRMEAFDDTPGVLLVNVRSYTNACYFLILSIIYEICAPIFSAKNFKISNDRTGLTRSAVFLIFFILVHAVGESARVQGTRRLQRVRLFLRSLVLDRLWIPGENCRGICAVECATAHLRWFEEDLESEVVFWIYEWSNEFGYHWVDAAHVHDHSPLSVPLRRY